MKSITDQEKAALYFQILENCNDWQKIYAIAVGESKYNSLTDKTKQVYTSRWKNNQVVQIAYEDIKRKIYSLIQEERKKAVEESKNEEGTEARQGIPKSEDINFLNLDEFLKYANSQANTIQDEKERRAWVEMIGKYMNFKESDEQEQQIKAYLPVVCSDCEIYKRCSGCSGCYKAEPML